MAIEKKTFCPLGNECEKVVDGVVTRCAWFQHFKGTDAQGNETDDEACAIAWTPILMLEQVRGLAGVQAATESARNENVSGVGSLVAAMREISAQQKNKAIGEV